jgi:hypothetical protein
MTTASRERLVTALAYAALVATLLLVCLRVWRDSQQP